ncbi:MAG: tyrosine-type recombinase/integrase [Candidatus Methanomethylicaceae archaeon]
MIKRLENYLAYFHSQREISAENKKAVMWFLDECAAEGLSEARQAKYVFGFTALLKKFVPREVNLNKATESQLKSIVAAIHRSSYTDTTQCFFKQCLKKFYKLKNGGTFPKKVDFIKTTEKKKTTVKKEDLFTCEEVRRAVSQLKSIRDRAYVMMQYESGARTGEMINATLSDVSFDERGDFIRLHGLKGTPDRVIQLIESGFYLKEWIRSHPCGGDPFNVKDLRAPLWVKLEQFRCTNCGVSNTWHNVRGCGQFDPITVERMTPSNIQVNFERACMKAGIKKRSYRLYNLRHSRITEVAKFLSHEQLCKFAGWKPGSGQFHVYVHLDSEDVNQAIRKQYGMGQEAEKQPIICKICWQKNDPERSECLRCRRPLKIEALAENRKVDEVREALRVLAELQEQGKLEELLRVARALG